jgi:glycosyltransferase involved in cell wall biosynthesis
MGSAETWMMSPLRHWAAQGGPACHFLMTSGKEGLFDNEARALGATLYYAKFSRKTLIPFIRKFRRILRTQNFDAIHHHQGLNSGWHYLLGTGLLPPVLVSHIHLPLPHVMALRDGDFIRQMTIRVGLDLMAHFATQIAGTSSAVIEESGLLTNRFQLIPKSVVYCGIQTDAFRDDLVACRSAVRQEFGWSPDTRVVLFAGRMDKSAEMDHPFNFKNSRFASEVAIAAMRLDDNFRVLFVGEQSPAMPSLQSILNVGAGSGRFAFAGIRQDIARLMLGSDVLLLPSAAEGLGVVAVEAQASGLPVLASTGVPIECSVATDKVHFLDLTAGVEQWAQALTQLASMPRDLERCNRLVAESEFSIERSAQTLQALYEGGLAGSTGR